MNTTVYRSSKKEFIFCEIFGYYFHNTLNLIGIVTNSICIFIFAMILKNERQQSNMFRYFFLKSINDLIYSLTQQSSWIEECLDCPLKYLYSINIVRILFYWYFAEILLLASGLFELAATFDCYNLITQKYQFYLTKKSFYIVSITIYAISTIFEFIYIIKNKIYRTESGYDYKVKGNLIYKVLHLFNVITRDFLILTTIIILNMLILYKMKQVTKNRQAITNNSQRVLITNSQKAEKNKIKMIVSFSLNFFILHLANDLDKIINFTDYSKCLGFLSFTLFDIAYYDSIIFYLYFNNTFRRIFINYFTFRRLRNRIIPISESNISN
jgi:hypothetical protein